MKSIRPAVITGVLGWCFSLGVLAAPDVRSDLARAAPSDAWQTSGHDWAQTYYSPLTRINRSNVGSLGYAWSYDLQTTHGLEATPVVVDGVMYASGPWGWVHAVDARNGKGLWSFDPHVDGAIASKVCCDEVNRGLAVAGGRVFVAALDGRLIALDAKTGKIEWQADTIIDHTRGYTVTGGVYIANDVAVIGNSGAEYDARGYVSAYDLRSGKLRWRFFIVPGSANGPFENPELKAAARTWDPHSHWEVGLGGTAWDGMAYDPKLDLLYVGTGNAALYPRKVRSPRGGDNLYLASILALHPRTGRLAWYYQTTPGEQWDYTATQKMILADVEISGKTRQVLMQAPKNGFFYVLDRKTGELLSAEPYVAVNWASHVDKATGRPIETGQGDYSNKPQLVFPSLVGGHSWHPMAFNPQTGLVYIPTIEAGAVFWMPDQPFEYTRGADNEGALYAWTAFHAGTWGMDSDAAKAKGLPPLSELARGQPDTTIRSFLRAWNPLTNKVAWQVETSDRWVGQVNAMWNGGGVLTTGGGLVIQGRSTGNLHAYHTGTGQQLASIPVGTSIMAAPMTYELEGVQYVAVLAGFGGALGGEYPEGTAAYRYGNAGRIVAFRLGGGAVPLPPEVQRDAGFPHPSLNRFGTAEEVERGSALFRRNCSICHTNNGAAGTIPDLRRMTAGTQADFENIVLKGVRASKGMGSFAGVLSEADVHAIHAALVESAWQEYERQHPGAVQK